MADLVSIAFIAVGLIFLAYHFGKQAGARQEYIRRENEERARQGLPPLDPKSPKPRS